MSLQVARRIGRPNRILSTAEWTPRLLQAAL
jgi:hypothetical protein